MDAHALWFTGPKVSSINCFAFVAQPVDCPIDVVFVLDESGSIGWPNFDLMKSFLSQLVSRLDIDSGQTRVGLVTFASGVGTHFNLNAHSTVAAVQSAIASLGYAGGTTNTHLALAYVRTTMLISAAGDRPDVPNVVVVLTDGQSTDTLLTVVSIQVQIANLNLNLKLSS